MSAELRETDAVIAPGNVAVVTGAASGIGRALARCFAGEKMRVVLADVDAAALERAVAALRDDGADVIGLATDVSSSESVDRCAAETLSRYGAVHVVCNNAGVTKHDGQAMWELTENDWRWLVGVNLWGVIHGVRAFVPPMLEQGFGYIVNTASMAGLVVGGGAYGVAKHAVVALSENLYVDLRERHARIGVSCLCPGLVATNIVESERARPAELRDDDDAGVTQQNEFRNRVAAFTQAYGASPDHVAALVLEGVKNEQFYLCVEDPPIIASANERIQLRMENMLDRKNPVALLFRNGH